MARRFKTTRTRTPLRRTSTRRSTRSTARRSSTTRRRIGGKEEMNETQLRLKKQNAIKIANNFQEKADKWFALARKYNDEIVGKWLKRNWRKRKDEL